MPAIDNSYDHNTSAVLNTLGNIVQELSRHLSAEQRYGRLLQALRETFPCNACALLQLSEHCLTPNDLSAPYDGLIDTSDGDCIFTTAWGRF